MSKAPSGGSLSLKQEQCKGVKGYATDVEGDTGVIASCTLVRNGRKRGKDAPIWLVNEFDPCTVVELGRIVAANLREIIKGLSQTSNQLINDKMQKE
jgi:hypothetical protein